MHRQISASKLQRSYSEVAPHRAMAPLHEVVWRRKLSVTFAMTVAVLVACAYIVLATRVYRAAARVVVEQNAPKLLNESHDYAIASDAFLQTQAESVQSIPVLTRAIDTARGTIPNLLSHAGKDPVGYFRDGHGLKVEPAKKSDVIVISVDSAYPQEAIAFANAVVDAYVTEQAVNRQATGNDMLRVLRRERAEVAQRITANLEDMAKYRKDNGVVEVLDGKGNTILARTSALSTSYTQAEMDVMDLQAELKSVQTALGDPQSAAAYVEAQQQKNKESGDHELDELRSQRLGFLNQLTQSSVIQGGANQHVKVLESQIDSVTQRIAQKEQSMAQAMLISVNQRLAAATEKRDQLRASVAEQTQTALALKPELYADMEANVQRLQKSLDTLDSRITELSVNTTTEAGPLNVSVMETATLEDAPVKPAKMMILAAALLVGALAGVGTAVARETVDLRLHSPSEVRTALGVPVVATIPPIADELSAVSRGRLLHLDTRSPIAESYRSMRTAIHLGSDVLAKTLVVVSPSPGEGKSTTASNVALAFAQAGERTLLLDCDLREPVQHMVFEVHPRAGVSDVLTGAALLRDAVLPTDDPNLFLMPCGTIPNNPSELLASKRFSLLMQELTRKFDRIIIDTPPLLHATDGCILASSADVTLMVLRMNQSLRESGVAALEYLDRVGANVLGVVANGASATKNYHYYGNSSNYATHATFRLPAAQPQLSGESNDDSQQHALVWEQEPDWAVDGA